MMILLGIKNELYLNATDEENDININATLTATDNAQLKITGNVLVGLDESGFTGRIDLDIDNIMINGDTYTVINNLGLEGSTTITELQGINSALGGNYVLGSNIDASDTSTWTDGFDPLGENTTKFTGNFDGLGHTVSNLTINRASENYVGLFGKTDASSIKNIGIKNADITGYKYVGTLVGKASNSTIINSYATSDVSANNIVGGLVGSTSNTNITNSYTTGNVSSISASYSYAGGLVGNASNSSITNSYATGFVSGTSSVGGLVGYNDSNSTISNSYATGTVSGDNLIGGLVGYSEMSDISNSYATGSVSGDRRIGGLVGFNYESTISNSYATGSVSGDYNVGGLVGYNYESTITNSYATGSVSGNTYAGGLVGSNDSTISDSYYDKTINPNMDDETLYGKTTTELQTPNTFSSWDMSDSSINGFYPTLMPNGSSNIWEIIFKEIPVITEVPQSSEETQRTEEVNNLIASLSSTLVPDIVLPPSKQAQAPQTNQNNQEETQGSSPTLKGTRVALSEGSLITLVDGGASLPSEGSGFLNSENSNNDEEGNK